MCIERERARDGDLLRELVHMVMEAEKSNGLKVRGLIVYVLI